MQVQSNVVFSLQSTDGWKAQPGVAAEAPAVMRDGKTLHLITVSGFSLSPFTHFVKRKHAYG